MNAELAKAYLESGGYRCPRCGHKLRSLGRFDPIVMELYLKCYSCGTRWTELFQLAGVEIGDVVYWLPRQYQECESD